ncbi:MAG: hypothetical protein MI807_12600, partial [Verrucomicrobiales bacterium]|nr:hypothetical protein [Verrucomicrobiales bacterium]
MQEQDDKAEKVTEATPAADSPKAEAPVEATASESASGVVKPEAAKTDGAPVIQDAATPSQPDPEAVKEVTSLLEAAEKSTDATAEVTATTGEVAESVTDAAAEAVNIGVSSQMVFLLGLGLLALFIYYFATETAKRKRIVGSFLAVAVTGLCVWLASAMPMKQGIELQGGVSMKIRIVPNEEQEVTPSMQQQAIDVLEKRLNDLGTGEVLLAPEGEDGIFLQMPGVGEEVLKEIEVQLAKVARLEFSILHPESRFMAQR